MKFFGIDSKQINKGYFGVRRCSQCNQINDVNLVDLTGTQCVCFFPIKKYPTRHFLVCSNCGAALEINEDLWNYYNSYPYRFDKKTTDEIVATLDVIDQDLKQQGVNIKCGEEKNVNSLNMIFDSLCKKFDNPQNVEELVSVYFSK